MDNLTTKQYIGIIEDFYDETMPTKYIVVIPELTQLSQKIIAENHLNKYIAVKNTDTTVSTITEGSTQYLGSYIPLKPGIKVNIRFSTPELSSAYIDSIHYDSVAVPPGQSRNDYYLLMETPNGSRIYADDAKRRIHISNSGNSDIFMDNQSVILQTSKDNKVKSFFELSENGLVIKFGKKSFIFNDSGFVVNHGEDSNTFINITSKGVSIKGEEFVSIDTNKLDIRGESTNIQSQGDFSIRGNVLNLTGTQKAALNSSVVHVEGWLSTYIKAGLELNLESKVAFRTQSLIKDELNLAVNHSFSSIDSKESLMATETSTFKANAIATVANDGIMLNNLGIASAVAPSLSTSLIALNQTLHVGFGLFGTFMSFDNIASSVVGSVLTDTIIADTASVASTRSYSLAGVFTDNKFDTTNFLNKLNKDNILKKQDYSKGVLNYEGLKDSVSFSARRQDILGKSYLNTISSNLLK